MGFGNRTPFRHESSRIDEILESAREFFRAGRLNLSFDCYDQAAGLDMARSADVLAELYDRYQELGEIDRHTLYQSRFFDFGIEPGDQVLDVGSGNVPLRLATHLVDIALDGDQVGRAGQPFKMLEGREIQECPVERMPFADRQFDFVYCSHVLEHAADPAAACEEIMRVGRRGYIETPSRSKDLFFNTARLSNHRWWAEVVDGTLVFTGYTPRDLEGLGNDLLMRMLSDPRSVRDKALWALMHLKADRVDSMLLWDGSFRYEIRLR